MEFEKQNNISSFNNIGSQEVYAQEDSSFEADQENLCNSSASSDQFKTPSAKFVYDQISSKKQPQNVRQTLFHNLDPFNESNAQNKIQNQTFNNAFNGSMESTICIDKESVLNQQINNQIVNNNKEQNDCYTIQNKSATLINHNNSQTSSNLAMDLSTSLNHNQNLDQQMPNNRHYYDDLLKERDCNEKLKKYVEQLNQLNQSLSEAILAVQDKFETNLNEKNATIQDLTLQNSVIAKERKLAVEDVQGLENSFSELHRRYEKLKLTLESCKKKEELFQEECLAFSEKLEESQRLNNEYKQRIELLENEKSNFIQSVKMQTEKEVTSLRAQLKKVEMRYNSVQNQLEQKTQENLELNKMVDELTK